MDRQSRKAANQTQKARCQICYLTRNVGGRAGKFAIASVKFDDSLFKIGSGVGKFENTPVKFHHGITKFANALFKFADGYIILPGQRTKKPGQFYLPGRYY